MNPCALCEAPMPLGSSLLRCEACRGHFRFLQKRRRALLTAKRERSKPPPSPTVGVVLDPIETELASLRYSHSEGAFSLGEAAPAMREIADETRLHTDGARFDGAWLARCLYERRHR